jgi:hypothetical protein
MRTYAGPRSLQPLPDVPSCLTCGSLCVDARRCIVHDCEASWCSDKCVPEICEATQKPICMGCVEYFDGLPYCPDAAKIAREEIDGSELWIGPRIPAWEGIDDESAA